MDNELLKLTVDWKIKSKQYPKCPTHKICPIDCDTKSKCDFCIKNHKGLWEFLLKDIHKMDIYYRKLRYTDTDEFDTYEYKKKLITARKNYIVDEEDDEDEEIEDIDLFKKYISTDIESEPIIIPKKERKKEKKVKQIIVFDGRYNKHKFELFCDKMIRRNVHNKLCKGKRDCKCSKICDEKCRNKCDDYCKSNFAHSLSEIKITSCKYKDKCKHVMYDIITDTYIDDIEYICYYKHPKETLEKYCERIGYDYESDPIYKPEKYTETQKTKLINKYIEDMIIDYIKLEILQTISDVYEMYGENKKLKKKDMTKENIQKTIKKMLDFVTKKEKYKQENIRRIKINYYKINEGFIKELLVLIRKDEIRLEIF